MKKSLLFAAMAAFVGFTCASCSNDDDVTSSVSNNGNTTVNRNIAYAVTQNSATGSRATAVVASNYLDRTLCPNFQVWAYFTADAATNDGVEQGAQYVGANGSGIVVDNLSTMSPLQSIWDYNNPSDISYWPTQPLNFQAIMPASDPSFTVSSEVKNKRGHVVADVTIPTSNAAQKDIMFAQAVKQSGRTATANDPVNLKFSHGLTNIVFAGKLASQNITAEVQSITVCNADQKGKVGFMNDGTNIAGDVVLGSELASSRAYGKYAVGMAADTKLEKANYNTAKNLTATDGALMMLPQNREGDKWATTAGSAVSVSTADATHQTYLAVSCKIKSGNAYLVGNASSYYTVYIPFEINWLQGKKYTYTLVFGAGVGGFDEEGNPLNSMLPITYTVSEPTDWEDVNGGEVSF